MSRKQKLLFVYPNLSTFVEGDLEALRPHYRVTTYHFNLNTPKKVMVHFIKEFFWLLFHIWTFDKVYIWFGDYHSFLPILFARLTGKSSYLVIGGYDVCRIRSLKYGSFKNPVRGFMTHFSMKQSTMNLCVSQYVKRKTDFFAPKHRNELLFNGANLEIPASNPQKKPIVLTVGKIDSPRRMILKGIDRFIDVARLLPDVHFVIIGGDKALIEKTCGSLPVNLTVHPFMEHRKLSSLYGEAQIYCQLSLIESFCLTLAEAMLHGCYPIVTDVGALPEIVGHCGTIIRDKEITSIAEVIRQKLQQGTLDTTACKERIMQHFLLKHRQERLLSILQEIR